MSQGEDLRDWSMSNRFLAEAEHENYVNHNLEIARRSAADRRSSSAFSIEQNAIDAAIARHGLDLVATSSHSTTSPPTGSLSCSSSSSSTTKSASKDEENEVMQPPPVRRQRMEASQPNAASPAASETTTAASYLAYVYSGTYQNAANSNNNNNNDQDIDLNELAIKKTIDNLGLRRTL